MRSNYDAQLEQEIEQKAVISTDAAKTYWADTGTRESET